jgi:hypothetical protein
MEPPGFLTHPGFGGLPIARDPTRSEPNIHVDELNRACPDYDFLRRAIQPSFGPNDPIPPRRENRLTLPERRLALRHQDELTERRRVAVQKERDRIERLTDPSNYFEPRMTLQDNCLLARENLRLYWQLHPEILSRVRGPDLDHLLATLDESREKLRHDDFLVNNACRSAKKNLKKYEEEHREDLAPRRQREYDGY